jgi:hypothetical protein
MMVIDFLNKMNMNDNYYDKKEILKVVLTTMSIFFIKSFIKRKFEGFIIL